jgi:cobalamin biosynthesis protein CobT
MIPAKLRYEVKRLFENTATESFERNLKSGRLNVRALTRHSISPNLFQRRYEEEGIDSAVVILLDVSGSMYDGIRGKAGQPRTTRMASAAPTCAALLETLSAAQVATALVTFDDYTSVLKPWNMNARKAITLLESIDGMGGSDDATALMHVHNMLYRRPEQRRLCFVLTDGQGDIRQAKAQVASAARLGVTTIGIGINADVSHVYPNHVQIDSLDDLGRVTFTKLKLAA